MWLSWLVGGSKAKHLRAEEIKTADRRAELYTKLFEGQKRQHQLDEMVRKSIILLGGKNK